MKHTYRVEGSWPFPLDMLRRDCSRPASQVDRDMIARMSGEFCDSTIGITNVQIALVYDGDRRGHPVPNDARWRSFGWRTIGVPQIESERQLMAVAREVEAARRSGLSKLTEAERAALFPGCRT